MQEEQQYITLKAVEKNELLILNKTIHGPKKSQHLCLNFIHGQCGASLMFTSLGELVHTLDWDFQSFEKCPSPYCKCLENSIYHVKL